MLDPVPPVLVIQRLAFPTSPSLMMQVNANNGGVAAIVVGGGTVSGLGSMPRVLLDGVGRSGTTRRRRSWMQPHIYVQRTMGEGRPAYSLIGHGFEEMDLLFSWVSNLNSHKMPAPMPMTEMLVKSGHPSWKSLPMFVRHSSVWVGMGSTPVAGGLVTVGAEIRGPGPVVGVCYGINGGHMKDYLVGYKPSCAGDGNTKSWSTAGFVAILVSPIRYGELMISLGLHVLFDRIGCLVLLVWFKGFSRR